MEVTDQLNAPVALLSGKIRGTFRIGGPVGPTAVLDVLEKRRLLDPKNKGHIF